MHLGHYQQADDYLHRALAMFHATGDRLGQAMTLGSLAALGLRLGRHQQAARHQQQTLAMYREIGDRPGEASALNGLSLKAAGRAGQRPQCRTGPARGTASADATISTCLGNPTTGDRDSESSRCSALIPAVTA
jgi:hypothetical protein